MVQILCEKHLAFVVQFKFQKYIAVLVRSFENTITSRTNGGKTRQNLYVPQLLFENTTLNNIYTLSKPCALVHIGKKEIQHFAFVRSDNPKKIRSRYRYVETHSHEKTQSAVLYLLGLSLPKIFFQTCKALGSSKET